MQARSLTTALLITATLTGWAAQASSAAPEPRFTVSFPGGLSPAGPSIAATAPSGADLKSWRY